MKGSLYIGLLAISFCFQIVYGAELQSTMIVASDGNGETVIFGEFDHDGKYYDYEGVIETTKGGQTFEYQVPVTVSFKNNSILHQTHYFNGTLGTKQVHLAAPDAQHPVLTIKGGHGNKQISPSFPQQQVTGELSFYDEDEDDY